MVGREDDSLVTQKRERETEVKMPNSERNDLVLLLLVHFSHPRHLPRTDHINQRAF